MYKYNPKVAGSGIITAIPQTGTCPNKCEDCFFQSGRSYLEPLVENLPNMPDQEDAEGRIVRVNDGNDSNVNPKLVMQCSYVYEDLFYNTAIPKNLEKFGDPVVLTVNPGKMTDTEWHKLDPIPKNLMFVRVRTNTWNIKNVVDPVVEYYTSREVPVVLTFMAYYNNESIPNKMVEFLHRDNPESLMKHSECYVDRKRTLNNYWAITTWAWRQVMVRYQDNKWVYSCGKIEGELGDTKCRFCGNCIREYYATQERLRV